MNKTFFKRRYFDFRIGGTMVSPMIQMANFTMITFMWINHIIPIEIFLPIFMLIGFMTLSYIGVRFRKHQATTDAKMIFERQVPQATAFYNIMLQLEKISNQINLPLSDEFRIELEYLEGIAKQER